MEGRRRSCVGVLERTRHPFVGDLRVHESPVCEIFRECVSDPTRVKS